MRAGEQVGERSARQADPFPTRYELEGVLARCGASAAQPREYRRFIGRRPTSATAWATAEQVAEGRLTAVSDDMIELQLGEGKHLRTVAIPLVDIVSARLANRTYHALMLKSDFLKALDQVQEEKASPSNRSSA